MNEMKKNRYDPPAPVPGSKGDKGGSFDDGDPSTTNLYIGNIAPSVTGNFLIFCIFLYFSLLFIIVYYRDNYSHL